MTDTHIHIGQFYETYYDPIEVMDVISSAGVSNCWYSSTTSCKENVQYSEVEKEIKSVSAHYSSKNFKPFLWYIPEYEKQGITVEKAMSNISYVGIKLHPRANNWDLENSATIDLTNEIFDYADKNKLSLLIHTGYDSLDEANKFSRFFGEYKNANIILAHCRPIEQILLLLQKYDNVYCDTAFVSKCDLQKISESGFSNKIFLGSDFPITHYFKQKQSKKKIRLTEQYSMDKNILEEYKGIIEKTLYVDCQFARNIAVSSGGVKLQPFQYQ
jgi:predicted TIM-barrel fold metal-dependent hydrolase